MKTKNLIVTSFISIIFTFGTILSLSNIQISKDEKIKLKDDMHAELFYIPEDKEFNTQKKLSYDYIANSGDLESVWDITKGSGTKIAIIDTGIDINHPDFSGKILPTSAYFETATTAGGYLIPDKTNRNGYKVNKTLYSTDSTCLLHDYDGKEKSWNFHGSNVAGTSAGLIGGGDTVGIAPEADLLIIKTDMSYFAISDAIDYARQQNVDVINLSLGGYAEDFTDGFGEEHEGYDLAKTLLQGAIDDAYNAGIIVVAAAGNEATDYPSYPACNNHVISVGALEKSSSTSLAYYTNFNGDGTHNKTGNKVVDILAPGFVYAPSLDNGNSSIRISSYTQTQGTSFASPIVAGAACLWKSIHPYGTPDEFEKQLLLTAYDQNSYTNKTVQGNKSYVTCGRLDIDALLDYEEAYIECESITAYAKKNPIEIGETTSICVEYSPLNCTDKTFIAIPRDESICSVNDETNQITGLKAGTTIIDVLQQDFCEDSFEITVIEKTPIGETITINRNSFSSERGEYAWYDWSSSSISGQAYIYATTTDSMQLNGSKTGKAIFSTTSLESDIASISMFTKKEKDSRNWKLYLSNNPYSTSNINDEDLLGDEIGSNLVSSSGATWNISGSYQYFLLVLTDSNPCYIDHIKVSFKQSTPKVRDVQLDKTNLDLDLDFNTSDDINVNVIKDAGVISSIDVDNSDPSVICYDLNGNTIHVSALTEGESILTVSCGEISASCLVTVSDIGVLTSISIENLPEKISYRSDFDCSSIEVRAYYSNGKNKVVEAILNGAIDVTTLGTQTLNASYTENGVTKTDSSSTVVTNFGANNSLIPEEEKTDSFTFTSASWGDSSNSWTSNKEGNDFNKDQGVQVSTGSSEANATSKNNFNNIHKVIVSYSTNAKKGEGAIKITVNGVEVSKSVTNAAGGITPRDLEYDFDNLTGKVNIYVTCSTNSIYIKGISIVSKSESHFDWTFEEQATSYSIYFLKKTGEVCDNDGNTNIDELTSVWEELKNEFNYMLDGSKDFFINAADDVINHAKQRYNFIISKYTTNVLDDFIVSSTGLHLSYPSYFNKAVSFNESTLLVVAFISITTLSIVGFLYFANHKRKEK